MEAVEQLRKLGRSGPLIGAGALALICVLGASGGRIDLTIQRNPIPVDSNSIDKGRSLYLKHCASCHGAAGRGDGSAGRDLDPPPSDLLQPEVARKTDVELFRKITRGRRPMPTFRKLMSEEQRWHVINYLRSLESRTEGDRQ